MDFNNKVMEHFEEEEIDEFFKFLKKVNEITKSL